MASTTHQINKSLEEARRLVASSPGLSAVASRNAAEIVLTEIGAGNGASRHKNESMSDYLRRLKGEFPEDIYDKMQRIRLTGNAGAHGDKVTVQSARQSIVAAEQVAAWYNAREHGAPMAQVEGLGVSFAGRRDKLSDRKQRTEKRRNITREEPASWNIRPQSSNAGRHILTFLILVCIGAGALVLLRSQNTMRSEQAEIPSLPNDGLGLDTPPPTDINIAETPLSARERLILGSDCAQAVTHPQNDSALLSNGNARSWHACVEDLRFSADNGYPEAYLILGHLYLENANDSADTQAAIEYFKSAANNGISSAFAPLSRILLEEGHTYTNLSKGLDWALRAAETGDRESISRVFWMYAEGIGTNKDIRRAEEWAIKAAALDLPRESCWLADRLLRHSGDEDQGKKLLLKYQDSTDPMCRSAWGQQLALGVTFDADYHRAMELLLATSELGDPDGTYMLGQLYEHGLGTPPDAERAESFYRLSYNRGQSDAGLALGLLLLKKIDLSAKNSDKVALLEAAALLRDAADRGNVEASAKYGEIIISTSSLDDEDERNAEKYLRYAADNGNSSAMFFLGRMTSQVRGDDGWQLMRMAADLGVHSAAFDVGMSCVGTEQQISDVKCATKYLKIPADDGNAEAAFALAELYVKQSKPQEAIRFFERSGQSGYALGYLRAGKLALVYGEGSSDRSRGLELLKIAASNRVPGARLAYARALTKDGTLSSGLEEGRKILTELADSDDADRAEAMFVLAQSYKMSSMSGFYSQEDIKQASRWYWSAHLAGYPQALFEYNYTKTQTPLDELMK